MLAFLWNLGAFILALGILVTVHEFGHFWVARKAGVKVLRFSVGFGKPLLRWHDKLGTEYVIAMLPLGGYVKMLDERVEAVPDNERHLSFNAKSVYARIAIVAAGPIANFLFAIFALTLMYFIGVQSVKPIIGEVEPQSRAALAGFSQGQQITRIGEQQIHNWQDATFAFMQHLGDKQVEVTLSNRGIEQIKRLNLTGWQLGAGQTPLNSLGITPFRPNATLTLALVAPDSAAQRGGLQKGDVILQVNEQAVTRWQGLVDIITAAPAQPLAFLISRDNAQQTLIITPESKTNAQGVEQGYLGVVPVVEPWPAHAIAHQDYGLFSAIGMGVAKTGQMVSLSLEMIVNLISGQVSVKNLSGPVGIAVGAGTSVSYGLVAFLSFLALISVNLGVFNLLPLPVLDGGHLMYYLIELIRKKPVSEKTQEFGFKIGALLLLALTCFALFNDVSRL